MIKVITYGTFDLLHYGHIRLLERAKSLGDYLIVGVTADDFDRSRGKINVQQSLMDRIEGVKNTNLADEIIVEEYEGQKIDDIKRYGVDIFTIGSDWLGKFDYLKEYCKVIYLDRTEGISSTDIRSQKRAHKMGLIGDVPFLVKFLKESQFVNGIDVVGIYSNNIEIIPDEMKNLPCITNDYEELLSKVDSLYIISHPFLHYEQIKQALEHGIHVLCESPIAIDPKQFDELNALAISNNCVLVDALRTAYSMAYERLMLFVKSGGIGQVKSVDATCTSIRNIDINNKTELARTWNSICDWGPTAMLPVFQLLGTNDVKYTIITNLAESNILYDNFTKIDFIYPHAVASVKVAKGVKSEGELIISGTNGYIYVPAPWWKTDYFEVRYENPENNKRYFYQLDGEGLRYELVDFIKQMDTLSHDKYISEKVSREIVNVISDFYNKKNIVEI
jgi:choline-phosphate cytidylyltransferase